MSADLRPILVVGATGMLGRPVAERLRDSGAPVRVLSRDPARAAAQLGPGLEYVEGDVGTPASIERALDGCRGVHVNLRGATLDDIERVEIGGADAIARAAAKAGAERLTYLSGAGIEAADPRLLPVRVKSGAEAAIRASGVPYTILRATHFMESLDLFVRGRHAELLTPQPHKLHYLAASDYADQVVRAYANRAAANRALTLLGPQAFTMREALEIYVARTRPDLTIRELPLFVARIIARFVRDPGLRMAVTLFDAFRRIPETGDAAEADALLGKAETTLEQWCERRRHNRG
jgi:uncharacterized protein YbjT (DUF2867 family)